MYRYNRGTHWRDAKNPRLRRLAEDSAYQVYPEMEYAEDEHDGTIEVIFGSTGAGITLRLIDSESSGLFLYGYCTLLAAAVADRTGLPLAVFTTNNNDLGWSGHAGVLVGENQVMDIEGIKTVDEIMRAYKVPEGGFSVMSRQEAGNILFDDEYRDDPYSFLEELEQLVLEDFAEFVIEEYKVKSIK